MAQARQSAEVGELVSRLAKVTAAVGYVQHGGKVDFGRTKYSYATQADLIAAVREHMAAQELAVTTSVTDVQQLGKDWLVQVEYTMRHGDQWVSAVCPGYGQGDKGLYAAITGSQKYWLRTTFLIATGDDPEEYDNQRATQGGASRETPTEKTRRQETPTPQADPAVVDAISAAAQVLVEMRAYDDRDAAHTALKRAVYQMAGRDIASMTHQHVRDALAAITEERLG